MKNSKSLSHVFKKDVDKILEKDIEKRLKSEVEKLGGIAYKFSSPQRRSVPDRLCIFPTGLVYFVECKAPGKKPSDAQWREMNRLDKLGHYVTWVSTYEEITQFVYIIKAILSTT